MRLENFISDLRGTSKPFEKQDILKRYESELLLFLLKAAHDPFILFHVNVKKSDVPVPGSMDLIDLPEETKGLLFFCSQSNSNKQNREKVVEFLEKLNAGSQELLMGTLNKNWKSGLGVRNILKVYPKSISCFDVQLANTFDREKDYPEIPFWIWSYKLDGLRCIALRESSDENYDKGKWTLYSRKGKEFLTVEHLKPQLESLYEQTGFTFFDGELYKHGLPFEEIQGPVMAFTQGQVEEMEYHIFIGGQKDNFLAGENEDEFTPLFEEESPDLSNIYFVNKETISRVEIEEKLEEAFASGYEGIMLRDPNRPYDYKRSNAILKLKQSLNDVSGEIITDCVVDDIEYDDFPVIENGEMRSEYLLVRLWVVQPDGVRCKVGSGYSLDFRRHYTKYPEQLVGKTVEVKHQLFGKQGRMRFPRLYRVREDI